MNSQAERDFLTGQLAQVNRMIELTPNHPLMTPSLQGRRVRLQAQLAELERQPAPRVPEATLLFAGGPALGSEGLEVKFSGKILDAYQDMVATQYAAERHGSVAQRGVRSSEAESKLFLTAIRHGSFGFQLSQPKAEDFVAASQVIKILDQMTLLLEAAGTGDEEFDRALETVHPRVLSSLGRFFGALKTHNASCRVITANRQCELTAERIENARERVNAATETPEHPETLTGVFKGATLLTWKFDFVIEDGRQISGTLADEITERQATQMNLLTSQRTVAEVKVTTITTRSGKQISSYELTQLTQWAEQPAQALPAPSQE